MNGRGFTSAFATQLAEYVEFKRAMGCDGASRIWYLNKFDSYCAEHERTLFDQETVEAWVTAQLATSGRYRSWMSYIRDLGRFLRATGHTDAYVLSDRWKSAVVPARPYLLTAKEIDAFFAAAAQLNTASPWRWQASAFFTLMHSSGLRTCEVRRLLVEHVDLPGRHIDVIWSKGRRSRRLPITSDIADVLAACDDTSRSNIGAGRETFFTSSTGQPVTAATVGVMFNRIWDNAGLARPASGQRPRPYDFRHHFAYANIERWMADGIDVGAMLPYLSTYMGHATVESTYYYIHTSPGFMDAYGHITAGAGSLLPEVGFE
ncbi:tyrosine-type recombinase/integrase [Rhodococcus opacus]|uniref:tyrosine-type recombinase/integrase n=1 Tax=Rhodococcus opacus TaxID=37919 RepID=UPI0002FDF6BF|nr:tyrosine-type recombinase/integrase [Rhodococcus opacus]MDX5965317.1 tyrosine-type recombinase/integrase [Rhodococcus opacus]